MEINFNRCDQSSVIYQIYAWNQLLIWDILQFTHKVQWCHLNFGKMFQNANCTVTVQIRWDVLNHPEEQDV